jgi:hypothetical protein
MRSPSYLVNCLNTILNIVAELLALQIQPLFSMLAFHQLLQSMLLMRLLLSVILIISQRLLLCHFFLRD